MGFNLAQINVTRVHFPIDRFGKTENAKTRNRTHRILATKIERRLYDEILVYMWRSYPGIYIIFSFHQKTTRKKRH